MTHRISILLLLIFQRFLIKANYFLIRGKTWLDRNKEIEINLLVLSLSGVLLFGDNHNFGLVLGWN